MRLSAGSKPGDAHISTSAPSPRSKSHLTWRTLGYPKRLLAAHSSVAPLGSKTEGGTRKVEIATFEINVARAWGCHMIFRSPHIAASSLATRFKAISGCGPPSRSPASVQPCIIEQDGTFRPFPNQTQPQHATVGFDYTRISVVWRNFHRIVNATRNSEDPYTTVLELPVMKATPIIPCIM